MPVTVKSLDEQRKMREAGRLAAEAILASFDRGQGPRGALASYDAAVRSGFIGQDLREVRNMRQVFSKGMYVGGALASAMIASLLGP